MLGQPLFPYTGKLDRMPSRPVHPFPTLWFNRIPSCFRSREAVIPINRNARSAAVLSRTSMPHTFGPVPLSLSLSFSLCLVLCYLSGRTHCIFFSCLAFILFFILFYRLMMLFGFSLVCSSGLVRDALGQFGYPWITHARWKFHGYPTRRSPRAHHLLAHSNSFFVLSVDLFWTNNLHKHRVDRA